LFLLKTFKALNGLLCAADVPLRNYSHTLTGFGCYCSNSRYFCRQFMSCAIQFILLKGIDNLIVSSCCTFVRLEVCDVLSNFMSLQCTEKPATSSQTGSDFSSCQVIYELYFTKR